MATYTVSNTGFVPELGLEAGAAEILQNVAVILSTRIGTVPLSRDIGLSQNWIDRPFQAAKAAVIAELAEAIEIQEPRAALEAVDVELDVNDKTGAAIKITVEVSISDGE